MSRQPGPPSFRVLLEWLEGRLDPDRARRVAAQVTGADEQTQRTVAWLRGFLSTARGLPLEAPPPAVRQQLKQYFAWWSQTAADDDEPDLARSA